MAGKLIVLTPPPQLLYIGVDGTGVPIVPWELEGRAGKDAETGKAKTREAKLGCVFTQTTTDDEGRPIRDPDSTTYVGAIETAAEFGRRIYAEAVRRRIAKAGKVVVLGDGAHWIANLVAEHFHGSTQIVDLYHAREHICDLGKVVYGAGDRRLKPWVIERRDELDRGDVEAVVKAFRRLRPASTDRKDEVRRAIGYFEDNAERMRYLRFRAEGLFVGSGVIEAGCRTIVGQRLKNSGMQWTVAGANAVIALRCCQLSGRWEDFWAARAAA